MEEDTQILAGGETDAISIHSGFPNPATERLSHAQALTLDINQLLIDSPSSTYLFRLSGHQWEAEGIFDGDIAVVDRALSARRRDLVISWQEDGFGVCRAADLRHDNQWWGIITAIIHQYRPAGAS